MAAPSSASERAAKVAPSITHANVVVIGGGPTGAITAMLLEKRGIPTTLIERQADFMNFDISKAYTMGIFGVGWPVVHEIPGLLELLRTFAIPSTISSYTLITTEGLTIPIDAGMTVPGDKSLVVLRPRLLQTLKTFLNDRTGVDAMYGTKVDDIAFNDDGSMDIRLTTCENTTKIITTRFVVACDGKNSIVLKHLHEAEQSGAKPSQGNVHSKQGFAMKSVTSPSVGMKAKSVVLNKSSLNKFNIDRSVADVPLTRINGVRHGEAKHDFVMNVWPINEIDESFFDGVLGMITRPPEHPLWTLKNIDEAFATFETNFPQLDVRACITPENMQRFVDSTAISFPAITRCHSLAGTTGTQGKGGGIVIFGDAAHCFPPNLGLGLNSGLDDASVLMRLIDNCKSGDTVVDLAERYHDERDADVTALMNITQKAAPYVFSDTSFSALMFLKAIGWREWFARRFPSFIYPPVWKLTRSHLPFSEVWRQGSVSMFRIHVGLLSLVGIPVTACLVRSLMGSKRP